MKDTRPDYTGPERRRRKVYLTRNTEYHFLDSVCVAVRHRDSGQWRVAHVALRRTLSGCVSFTAAGEVQPKLAPPAVGDALFFCDGGVGGHHERPHRRGTPATSNHRRIPHLVGRSTLVEFNKQDLGPQRAVAGAFQSRSSPSVSRVGVIKTKIGDGGSRTESSGSRALPDSRNGDFETPAGFEDFGHDDVKEADCPHMTLDEPARRRATGAQGKAVPRPLRAGGRSGGSCGEGGRGLRCI